MSQRPAERSSGWRDPLHTQEGPNIIPASNTRGDAMARNAVCFVCLSMLVILLTGDQTATAQQAAIQRKSLLQQDATIPGFQAAVTIVEIPAGVSEIRHTHP